MAVVYPQYGPGLGTAPQGNPALDALRALGSLSPQGSGSRAFLNPNRLTESNVWAPSGNLSGPQTGTANQGYRGGLYDENVSSGGRPGYGGNLSPLPTVVRKPRTTGPYPATPPVEVAGDQGVLESLRRAFPPRQVEAQPNQWMHG